MKAVVFQGPFDVAVQEVEDPRVEKPLDAVVRVTTANICGSDLHPYEGRAPLDEGMVMGHENTGIVEEVGSAVERIRVGDRVSVPFNIGCGTCRNCTAGSTQACLRANPSGKPTAGYGYPQMGPYRGGQAELLRVPWADFNLLRLPPGDEHEQDFAMLSDIFPTGYHGAELAGVVPGSTVVVQGAGPVGLMAAHSAVLRGAARVFVVDKEADRLELARQLGAEPLDFSDTDPVEAVMDATDGAGVDCGIEAVGYQAHDAAGHEHPEMTLDRLVAVVRSTGRIGVVGVYVPEDPGASDPNAQQGRIAFDYGTVFDKNLTLGHGQCPVKRYNRHLRDLIVAGRATPGAITSHELPLADAPRAYEQFDKRVDGWTKVLLHPQAA
ncbi:glutathione-independent formaldehyde dehydrogenase [Kitasatospora sp. NPDC048365]|uniref:glutathione-independent formaldehyde dehydrogenase n=1 Tax=Kitasatospora sp. NPDC048365 TaxID=3364050 RepID=UPI003711A0D1